MDFSDQQYSLKVILIALVVVLLILGGGAAGFFFWQSRQSLQTSPLATQNTITDAQINNTPLFLSLDTIQPIISSCKFVNYNACVEKTSDEKNLAGQTYDVFAQDDIFFWLNKQQKSPLRNLNVDVSPDLAQKYFPEYLQDMSNGRLTLSAGIIIQKVARQENINPRLLLILMELANHGQGPVFSVSADPNKPYFADNSGFFQQLATAAQELHASQLKYMTLTKETKHLPTSLTFFNKTYTVDPATNAETLALVDFFAKHFDQSSFERALAHVEENQDPNQNQVPVTYNFTLLYTLFYQVDPLAL